VREPLVDLPGAREVARLGVVLRRADEGLGDVLRAGLGQRRGALEPLRGLLVGQAAGRVSGRERRVPQCLLVIAQNVGVQVVVRQTRDQRRVLGGPPVQRLGDAGVQQAQA
jgi:hypothetical protein